jgi:spore maturation protein SpmB
MTLAIAALIWYFTNYLNKAEIELISKVATNFFLFSIIIAFIAAAIRKQINVYEAFIEGAKNGMQTSLTIIPYLVGMLVAIGVVRNAGVLHFIVDGLTWLVLRLGINADFTPALPTALMKPLSGSGAKALMLDTMKTYGVDSFIGRLSCIFQGSADTTFYIISLYFGSVGIKKTRYAISAGLAADFAGIIAAVFVGYLFFH